MRSEEEEREGSQNRGRSVGFDSNHEEEEENDIMSPILNHSQLSESSSSSCEEEDGVDPVVHPAFQEYFTQPMLKPLTPPQIHFDEVRLSPLLPHIIPPDSPTPSPTIIAERVLELVSSPTSTYSRVDNNSDENSANSLII